jgi:hypothetical protein
MIRFKSPVPPLGSRPASKAGVYHRSRSSVKQFFTPDEQKTGSIERVKAIMRNNSPVLKEIFIDTGLVAAVKMRCGVDMKSTVANDC